MKTTTERVLRFSTCIEDNRFEVDNFYSPNKYQWSTVKRVGKKMGLNFTSSKHRIKETEDIDLGKTEIIQSPHKVLDLFLNMIKLAKREILLILPTTNAFLREERIGTLELLRKSVLEQNVNVRIITPINELIETVIRDISTALREDLSHQEDKNHNGNFQVQYSDIQYKKMAVDTVTILVTGRKESLAIEKTDDTKPDFIEAVGLTTHSNSEPTVTSYVSIFEALWSQAQMVD